MGLLIVTFSMFFGPSGGNQMKKSVSSSGIAEEGRGGVESLTGGRTEIGNISTSTSTSTSAVEAPLGDDKPVTSALLPLFLEESAEFKILCESSVLSAFFTHMAINLANYTLLSYMPTYFTDVLHVPLSATAPYIVPSRFSMLMGVVISGQMSKYVLNNQLLTLTQTRRDGSIICMLGTALGLFALPAVRAPLHAALCLTWSTFFIGAFEVFLQSTYIDLTADLPEFAGFVCGAGNTLAAFPGALGPFFVSQMLNLFDSWVLVFWVMSLCLLGAVACHFQYTVVRQVYR